MNDILKCFDDCREAANKSYSADFARADKVKSEKWGIGKDIDLDHLVESFYDRYRYMVSLNNMSHEIYGLIRPFPFLYGYAKPFILRVGRLNFQLYEYQDYLHTTKGAECSAPLLYFTISGRRSPQM